MLPPASELERILQRLIQAHRSLLEAMEAHYAAMKAMDAEAMSQAGRAQEAARLRITALERLRNDLTARRGAALKVGGRTTLAALAKADPVHGSNLMKLRDELKGLVEEAARRSQIASRLAMAVLGHLNTAMRFLGGAMAQGGIYTRGGGTPMARRIGVIEAVG